MGLIWVKIRSIDPSNYSMDMSSNSQLVIFDRLFVMVAEFERSYIELNFLHVTIKAGEGGGQPFRDLSLLFMSLFQGWGRG